MSKKAEKTTPVAAGDRKTSSRLEKPLKWVGAITALLSLIFGLYQLTQLISDIRERQRQTAELYEVGKLQQSAADYTGL